MRYRRDDEKRTWRERVRMPIASSVIATLHNKDADRAVKIMKWPDGTFGCNEFRRDPEDAGRWTLVRENASGTYATQEQAIAVARAGWLRDTASPMKD
jgi:hypothetical protein